MASIFIVDKVGRKILFIVGCIGCGLTQGLFGLIYKTNSDDPMSKSAQVIALIMLVLFISFFSISHGPVCWSYLSEIMHPKTLTIAVCVNLIFTVLITLLTQPAIKHIGNGLFFIYAGIMIASLAIVIPFVKETKGLTKQEISELFLSNKKVEYTASLKDIDTAKEPLTKENQPEKKD